MSQWARPTPLYSSCARSATESTRPAAVEIGQMGEQGEGEAEEDHTPAGSVQAGPEGEQKKGAGSEVGQNAPRLGSTTTQPVPEHETDRLEYQRDESALDYNDWNRRFGSLKFHRTDRSDER